MSRARICAVVLPGTPALWIRRRAGSSASSRVGHGVSGHAVSESPRATKVRTTTGFGVAFLAGALGFGFGVEVGLGAGVVRSGEAVPAGSGVAGRRRGRIGRDVGGGDPAAGRGRHRPGPRDRARDGEQRGDDQQRQHRDHLSPPRLAGEESAPDSSERGREGRSRAAGRRPARSAAACRPAAARHAAAVRRAQPAQGRLAQRARHVSGRLGHVVRVRMGHRPRRGRQEEDGSQPTGEPATVARIGRRAGLGSLPQRRSISDGPARRVAASNAAHAASALIDSFSMGTRSVPLMADSPVSPDAVLSLPRNGPMAHASELPVSKDHGRNRVSVGSERASARLPAPRGASRDGRDATRRKRRRRARARP